MEREEAEQFPLVRDYDFVLAMGPRGGHGILLVPRKKQFIARRYGFGLLSLIPYLQEHFNEGHSITIDDLIGELEDSNEIILASEPIIEGENRFLYTTLNKLGKDKLVAVDRRNPNGRRLDFTPMDLVSKGENYDTARVYSIENYSESNQSPYMPSFEGPF